MAKLLMLAGGIVERGAGSVEDDLQPELDSISRRGGAGAIAKPKSDWVIGQVRRHILGAEGIEID